MFIHNVHLNFKIGQKLEAVDKKNPMLICCATVGAIKDDQIHIAFDGWSGTFDYWTRYDSRDIFPVGWCSLTSHPIQPPNTNKRKSMKPSNTFIPDLDALSATMPITIHFHSKCRVGPFIDRSRFRSMLTAPNHRILAKLILQEILGSCSETTKLAQRLFSLEGEVNSVVAAGKKFTVKIPSSSSISNTKFAEFLKAICKACETCPNLITLEPGPEKCDSCCKQEKIENKKKEEICAIAEVPRQEANNKNIRKSEIKKQSNSMQTKEGISGLKPAYKRRRQSDIDIESSSPSPTSSSSSNSNSSNSEKFSKIPRKSFDESVTTSTSRNAQTPTVSTSSGKYPK